MTRQFLQLKGFLINRNFTKLEPTRIKISKPNFLSNKSTTKGEGRKKPTIMGKRKIKDGIDFKREVLTIMGKYEFKDGIDFEREVKELTKEKRNPKRNRKEPPAEYNEDKEKLFSDIEYEIIMLEIFYPEYEFNTIASGDPKAKLAPPAPLVSQSVVSPPEKMEVEPSPLPVSTLS